MDEREGMHRPGRRRAKRKGKGPDPCKAMLDEGIVFPDIPPPIPILDVANPTFEED
jgi:hypothetical protein